MITLFNRTEDNPINVKFWTFPGGERDAIAPLQAEIERLRKALEDADNDLDWHDEEVGTCDHSVGVCMCDYWNMRRKMKAALSKENSND